MEGAGVNLALAQEERAVVGARVPVRPVGRALVRPAERVQVLAGGAPRVESHPGRGGAHPPDPRLARTSRTKSRGPTALAGVASTPLRLDLSLLVGLSAAVQEEVYLAPSTLFFEVLFCSRN